MLLAENDLSEPERRLCAVAASGSVLDLRDRDERVNPIDGSRWAPQRTIRAQLLRQLLLNEQVPNRATAVRVRGARIVGRLNLGGQKLECPFELYECYLAHEVNLAKAEAISISLRGSYLRRGLSARQLRVKYSVNLSRGFRCTGPVRLTAASIGGSLDCGGGGFTRPGGTPIVGDLLTVTRNVFLGDGFKANGQVRLVGAHVGGQLNLTGGEFRNHKGNATDADGDAINADGVQVDRGLLCGDGFKAEGGVRLVGARVRGQLDLTGGEFRSAGGDAINAERLFVDGAGFWQPKQVEGQLNLAHARATVWCDNEQGRSVPTALRGFRYEALHPEMDAEARIEWLERDPNRYSPQPYSQLAAIYRAEGNDRHARAVLVSSQKRRPRGQGWRSWGPRFWGRVLSATVGYGYHSQRALVWLLILAAVGSLAFKFVIPGDTLARPPSTPPHNAFLYVVDVMLPFVDLGYGKLVARGPALAVTAGLVLMGWVLVTAVVAAFAGILRRGD